ncbi:MAG: glycosyltransferase [Betaproteobacteria bacterium]|nr:glycosyltransferase [Betaproteobacteria bacterium]
MSKIETMSGDHLLTILIPTRNRAAKLGDALGSLVRAIEHADCAGKVVVTCVDNYSTDATRSVVEQFAATRAFVEYRHQDRECRTAEESLQNALQYARGDYVWSFGDDDQVIEAALMRLLPVLEGQNPDFILLNLVALVDGATHGYFEAPYPAIRYARGLDLFRDLGLVSATTTISCLCFRRAALSVAEWQRLSGISPIYSHSVAMMLAFHDRPAVVIPNPIVVYTANTLSEEYGRITRVATERRQLTRYSFTIGLIRLLTEASSRLGLPLETFHTFEEIELSESNWLAKNSLLGFFVARMVLEQIQLGRKSGRTEERFTDEQRQTILGFFERSPHPMLANTMQVAFGLDRGRQGVSEARALRLLRDLSGSLEAAENTWFIAGRSTPDAARRAAILFPKGRPFKFARGTPGGSDGEPMRMEPGALALTILIPTYNRGRNLARQLRGLAESALGHEHDVEVLVAVNACTDRTAAVLRAAKHMLPNLRALEYQEFVDSAEENVNRAIPQAWGRYVWLLGDDDEIVVPTLQLLLNMVRSGTGADAYVFNQLNAKEYEAGVNLHRHNLIHDFELPGAMREESALVECDYRDLVRRHGLTTAMALLSRHVVRKAAFIDSADYIAVSKIYSHVFGFMRALAGKRTVFVNYPLVARKTSEVTERFRRLTRKASQPIYWPWTTGLIRLARHAEKAGVVDPGFLVGVVETHPDGSHFQLVDEMFIQMLRQMMHYVETGEPMQLPSADDMREFLEYFQELAPKVDLPVMTMATLHARLEGGRHMQIARRLSSAALLPRLAPFMHELKDVKRYMLKGATIQPDVGAMDRLIFFLAQKARRNPWLYSVGRTLLAAKAFGLGARMQKSIASVSEERGPWP